MKYSDLDSRMAGKGFSWEKLIYFGVSAIITLIIVICLIVSSDTTPAKVQDYLPLYNRLIEVQGAAEKFLDTDGKVVRKDGVVTYTIENEQCEMTGKYDEDLNLIETSQRDKVMSVFELIIYTAAAGIGCFIISVIILFIAIYLIEFLVIALIEYIIIKKSEKSAVEEDDDSYDENVDIDDEEIVEYYDSEAYDEEDEEDRESNDNGSNDDDSQ